MFEDYDETEEAQLDDDLEETLNGLEFGIYRDGWYWFYKISYTRTDGINYDHYVVRNAG